MDYKLDFFKQKWVSKQFEDYNVEFVENYEITAGEIVEIAILLNNNCIAYGNYFEKLTTNEEKDSRFYFNSIGFKKKYSCKVAFYFDEHSLLINDFTWNYPFDEKIADKEEFFERIKTHDL